MKMGNLNIPRERKRFDRFDDTFKVLLAIFTLLLSTVIPIYRETSIESTIVLFGFYIITICSWSVANLTGGEKEYVWKFFSWFWLLGGIIQGVFMLGLGTLFFHGPVYAANLVIALCLYGLVFHYVKPLMEEDIRRALWIALLVAIPIGAVLCCLSLLGLI